MTFLHRFYCNYDIPGGLTVVPGTGVVVVVVVGTIYQIKKIISALYNTVFNSVITLCIKTDNTIVCVSNL